MENQNRSSRNRTPDGGAPARRGGAAPKGQTAPRRKSSQGESNSRSERVRISAEIRKRKKRRRDAFLIFILIVMLGALATVLSTTVFFKAEKIVVNNLSDKYSNEWIADASGLSVGDNLLMAKLDKAEAAIEKNLPYIRIATVSRKWPNAFYIDAVYADSVLAVQKGGAFIYIDVDGKVLETDIAQPDPSVAIVTGAYAESAVPGNIVTLSDEKTLNALVQILSVLNENEIYNITAVDVSNPTDIVVELDHRIDVKLGSASNAAEKIAFGKAVIEKNLSAAATKKLIIDLTTDAKAFVREKESPARAARQDAKTPTDAQPEEGAENPDVNGGDLEEAQEDYDDYDDYGDYEDGDNGDYGYDDEEDYDDDYGGYYEENDYDEG